MKVSAVLFALLLAVSAVSAATVTRDMPHIAAYGESVSVTLSVHDFARDGIVVLGELLPKGAKIVNWSIVGAQESRDDISFSADGRSLVWRFTANTPTPVLVYVVELPTSGEQATFDAVYALTPNQIGRVGGTINLDGTAVDEHAKDNGASLTGAFLGLSLDSNTAVSVIIFLLFLGILALTLRASHPQVASKKREPAQRVSLPGEYVMRHFEQQQERIPILAPLRKPTYGPPVHECTGPRVRPRTHPFTHTPIGKKRSTEDI